MRSGAGPFAGGGPGGGTSAAFDCVVDEDGTAAGCDFAVGLGTGLPVLLPSCSAIYCLRFESKSGSLR